MHSTHVGIVRERQAERLGLAFCVRDTREMFRRWIPDCSDPACSSAPRTDWQRRAHLGTEHCLRKGEENALAFLQRDRADVRTAHFSRGKAEQGCERFRAVLPLNAVILWLVWEASADGLCFQGSEYLSGFACWNTSSDLFYSPSPVHLPAEKWVRKQRRKMLNRLTGKRKEKR